jgi:hypothetical protein
MDLFLLNTSAGGQNMANTGAQLGSWDVTYVPEKSQGFVRRAIAAFLSRCFLAVFGLPE